MDATTENNRSIVISCMHQCKISTSLFPIFFVGPVTYNIFMQTPAEHARAQTFTTIKRSGQKFLLKLLKSSY